MDKVVAQRIREAIHYCNEHDESTEFMIQYIQDYAHVSFDCAMNYLYKTSEPNFDYSPSCETGPDKHD
jgi:hypothetical protein